MISMLGMVARLIPIFLGGLASSLWADQYGDFTYIDNGTTITIVDYPDTAVDEVVIPESIMGKPVTTIGSSAFAYCSGIKSVIIPNGVSTIEYAAFIGCASLEEVTIPSSVMVIGDLAFQQCGNLTNVKISAGVTTIGVTAFAGCSSLKNITLPPSVISIGDYAFQACFRLLSITIPASVTSLGARSFVACDNLKSACFIGDAPTMGDSVFEDASIDFAVYYFNDALGYTSPTWQGYTSVNTGAPSPTVPWLLENSFPYNESLQSDPNEDGVNLLMAYALNLDPRKNLCSSLPQPMLVGNELGMNFYGASEGVTYIVQSSTDLKYWDAEGVVLTAPDASGNRSATVPTNGLSRFMRLVVSY